MRRKACGAVGIMVVGLWAAPCPALAQAKLDGSAEHQEVGDAPPTTAVSPKEPDERPGGDDHQSPWAKKSDIDVRGFVHTLYEFEPNDELTHEFELKRARLSVEWSQGRLLEGQLEFEVTEALPGGAALELLRDAYLRIRPLRALGFRLGQFKKPFGALELWGRGDLPLINRGLANDWIVDELGFGGRDIGIQIEGRLLRHPRLEYQLGVYNGTGANTPEDGDSKDVAGRLEVRPMDALKVSASGSLKQFDREARPELPRRALMGEVDAELEVGAATILAEVMYGQNYFSIDKAKSWSAVLYAGYKIPLTDVWQLQLEPLVKGEVLKIEHHVRNAHIIELTAGTNLHVGDLFRLMVQGELIEPMRNALPLWEEETRFMIQAAMNMR